MTAGLVAARTVDGVGYLRLTRADTRNAISHPLVEEAAAAMKELVRSGVRVAVLEADPPVFCSGNDLSEVSEMTDAASTAVVGFIEAMLASPLLWIGSVSGAALGGGMAIVAACPVALASDQAWFALTERRLGFFPAGVLPYLEVVMDVRPAFRAALTGREIPAAEAATLGLVDEVHPLEQLAGRVHEMATDLCARPGIADAGREVWQRRFRAPEMIERRAQLDEVLLEYGTSGNTV